MASKDHWVLLIIVLFSLLLGLVIGTNIGVGLSLAQGPEVVCQNLRISILECPPASSQ